MAEIGAGILAYLYKDRVAEHLGNNLQIILKEDYGVKNDTTAAVDHLQSRYVEIMYDMIAYSTITVLYRKNNTLSNKFFHILLLLALIITIIEKSLY